MGGQTPSSETSYSSHAWEPEVRPPPVETVHDAMKQPWAPRFLRLPDVSHLDIAEEPAPRWRRLP